MKTIYTRDGYKIILDNEAYTMTFVYGTEPGGTFRFSEKKNFAVVEAAVKTGKDPDELLEILKSKGIV